MGYVKDFIDHAIITYAGEQDKEVEERCLLYYQQARKEVKEWLKKVLIKELSKSDYTSVYVKLYLPLGDMEVLGLHRMEGVFYNVTNFLTNQYWK